MPGLIFDPVTTELVIQQVKKTVINNGSSATLSALIVPTELELLVNNLIIIESVEVTDNGVFGIYVDGTVEVE